MKEIKHVQLGYCVNTAVGFNANFTFKHISSVVSDVQYVELLPVFLSTLISCSVCVYEM